MRVKSDWLLKRVLGEGYAGYISAVSGTTLQFTSEDTEEQKVRRFNTAIKNSGSLLETLILSNQEMKRRTSIVEGQ